MVVIRPSKSDDLEGLAALAELTGYGLTTLPHDAKLLEHRIRQSVCGFQKLAAGAPPAGENYLLILEDTETGRVIGCCGVISKIGKVERFYAYQIKTEIHDSQQVKVHKEIPSLHLIEVQDGPSEICSLFLSPDHRRDGNGRLLSLSRFLFMAEHPQAFDKNVLAEMRGVVDDHGHCAFWEAIGRHFFDMDFSQADYLSNVDKKFILELMPKYPIYIPLLPTDAQAVIGNVHPETRPALKMLEDEGFRRCDWVDIFEGGPMIQSPLQAVRAVRCSRRAVVQELLGAPPVSEPMLVANTSHNYRACKGTVELNGNAARISREVAAALQVKTGDPIRFVNARPNFSGGPKGRASNATGNIQ